MPVAIVKDKLLLRISWSNNFSGMYPGNGLMDGVGFPAAKKDPSTPELISTTANNSKPVGLSFSAEAIFLCGDEQRTRWKVTVKENGCIDLGKLDASLLESAETVT